MKISFDIIFVVKWHNAWNLFSYSTFSRPSDLRNTLPCFQMYETKTGIARRRAGFMTGRKVTQVGDRGGGGEGGVLVSPKHEYIDMCRCERPGGGTLLYDRMGHRGFPQWRSRTERWEEREACQTDMVRANCALMVLQTSPPSLLRCLGIHPSLWCEQTCFHLFFF